MDKRLIINISLFAFLQDIYIYENGESTIYDRADFEDLPYAIIASCQEENIKNIEIVGHPAYAHELAQDVYNYAMTKYNINDLNITVTEV